LTGEYQLLAFLVLARGLETLELLDIVGVVLESFEDLEGY